MHGPLQADRSSQSATVPHLGLEKLLKHYLCEVAYYYIPVSYIANC